MGSRNEMPMTVDQARERITAIFDARGVDYFLGRPSGGAGMPRRGYEGMPDLFIPSLTDPPGHAVLLCSTYRTVQPSPAQIRRLDTLRHYGWHTHICHDWFDVLALGGVRDYCDCDECMEKEELAREAEREARKEMKRRNRVRKPKE